jgi:CheY-like chemotaxis protein
MGDVVAVSSEPEAARLVLLVEDEILVRISSADLLREAGYRVVEADNGEAAVSLLEAGINPDLIVSDIRMPGAIDGLQLLALARSQFPHIPVLLASSHLPLTGDEEQDVQFLPKPYQPAALLGAVRDLTGGT